MRAPNGSRLPVSGRRVPASRFILDIKLQGCIAGATGLELPVSMSEPEWQLLGSTLAKAQSATRWWIGDWWSFGEHRYGNRKALVEGDDWQGPSFQTCMNAAAVATAFETSRRREVLSFSHHAEVASLSAEEADDLLNWAEEPIEMTGRARSVRTLRDEKRRRREHQRGHEIVVPSRDAPVAPRSVAVATAYVSGEPEPMAVRSVVVRINTPPSAPFAQSAPRYSGLSAFMYCLTQLGASDGAKIGALVSSEQKVEFLQAAQAARYQIEGLIGALGT